MFQTYAPLLAGLLHANVGEIPKIQQLTNVSELEKRGKKMNEQSKCLL